MKKISQKIFLMLVICGASRLNAQLVNCVMDAYKLRTGNAASGKIVEVKNMPFKHAWRISIDKVLPASYNIQLKAALKQKLSLGDKCYLSVYARAIEPVKNIAKGKVDVLVEKNSAPWTKFLYATIYPVKEWKRFDIPFKIKPDYKVKNIKSYSADSINLAFNLSKGVQTLEIAVVGGKNLGVNADFKSLPRTPLEYQGSEANAPWRKQALARINKIRKGDLTIKVVDSNGKIVPDATVKLEMDKHEFVFGGCLNIYRWVDNKRYQEEFLKLFNMAVFEGSMKWTQWKRSKKMTMSCLKKLRANGIPVRGHCLVWPSWKKTPKAIKKLENNKSKLIQVINEHIYNTAYELRNETVEWDVMNEPYTNHDLMDLLGEKVMIDWYKTAKEAAPKNTMYINDFNILTRCDDLNHPQIVNYRKTIKYLLDKGAPVEGIGMQSHFNGSVSAPVNVLKALDVFSEFKLPIKITEYDNNTHDEQLAEKYMRDFMIAIFSHPSVNGFLMWGFWDGSHWKNNAPIFNLDWTLKPSGKVYKKLVFKDWWTSLQGKTGADGIYLARGFKGDYILSISAGDKKIVKKIKINKEHSVIKIILK